MILITLTPVGVMQAWTSYKDGLWLAGDACFVEGGAVKMLGQLRMIGDATIIGLGMLPLAYSLFKTYPHLKAEGIAEGESVWDRLEVNP